MPGEARIQQCRWISAGQTSLGANLIGADLSGAILHEANLSDAILGKTIGAELSGAQLEMTKGHEMAPHRTAMFRPAEHADEVALTLYIDPGEAAEEDIVRLYTALSNLHRACGGAGLQIKSGRKLLLLKCLAGIRTHTRPVAPAGTCEIRTSRRKSAIGEATDLLECLKSLRAHDQ